MKLKNRELFMAIINFKHGEGSADSFYEIGMWVNDMEIRIEGGENLADVASETYDVFHIGMIRPSQFTNVLQILKECWVYGDELWKWNMNRYKDLLTTKGNAINSLGGV